MWLQLLGKDAGFSRAWRGELGLYRAAYGLGGVGLALVALVGDTVLDVSTSNGGATGWFFFITVAAGELAFAGLSLVATWRAAWVGRRGGRPYRSIAIGCAFGFVGIQLALTATWIGWSALAWLGLAPKPDEVMLRSLITAATGQIG